MHQAERDQILMIIKNFEEKKAYIPFFSDLLKHEVFGPVFKGLDPTHVQEINQIIHTSIIEKISGLWKTKWGQLFQRFFESQTELFWEFRTLNEKANIDSNKKSFQEKGRLVEQEMFRLEGILTEKMVGQEKGLDKVIGSFYSIVYSFFPRMNEIE